MQKSKAKKRNKLVAVLPELIFTLAFLVGAIVLLYPEVSDWANRIKNANLIGSYDKATDEYTESQFQDMWDAAVDYNNRLSTGYIDTSGDQVDPEYYNLLNIDGAMGYIQIPKISVRLEIFHGLGEDELKEGVGHMYGSSLPVGGVGTHAVLAAHRGLPSAKLFSDLDDLVIGDVFLVTILDKTLVYQVSDINVVLPEEDQYLNVQEGRDIITLVTCTPYGVNTHRLLVTGTRVDDTTTVEIPQTIISTAPSAKLVIGGIAAVAILSVMTTVTVKRIRKVYRKKQKGEGANA